MADPTIEQLQKRVAELEDKLADADVVLSAVSCAKGQLEYFQFTSALDWLGMAINRYKSYREKWDGRYKRPEGGE